MLAWKQNESSEVMDRVNTGLTYLLGSEDEMDRKLEACLAKLSQDTPWGHRQIAAQELGSIGNPKALPGLLSALSSDPFWMVRCAIIQALERIGDPGAIPTLREAAKSDGYPTVRSYAEKAIERLSPETCG